MKYTQTLMIRSNNLLNILAAVLVIEASVFSALLIVNDVQYSAQVTNDNGLPLNCGNNIVDGYEGEECDDGSHNGESGSSCSTCCIRKPVGQVRGSDDDDGDNYCACGNGNKEWPEQCDKGDKNGAGGSECSQFCKEIDLCGNGQRDEDERCDDGNADNKDGCTNDCRLPECGDGFEQLSNNEVCDDGNDNDNDGCSQDCQIERCGDYIKQSNEECDKGSENNDNSDCRSDCIKSFCGDGFTQKIMGEECDEGILNGTEISGQVRCTTTCTYPPPPPPPPVDNDDDDDSNGQGNQQVRPAAPSNQPTNLDDLRRKKNKQEKQLREAMRKSREEAEKRAQNVPDGEDNDDDETIAETGNDDGLHCFDSAGNIVNDRSRCDRGQEQYLFHRQDISDEEVRTELSRKLLGDNTTEEKRMHLLASLESARSRIDKMSASGNYDGEVQQYFEASIAWLDRGIMYFSTGDRTLEEIQQMAEPVRQLVEQASALVQQKLNLPSTRPDINPIVDKTERLVRKFRESFIALAQAKVALDRDALEKYVEAANLFANVKTLCLEDSEQCTRINDVLNILKKVQGPLQEQLEDNPEVFKKIQEMFEE